MTEIRVDSIDKDKLQNMCNSFVELKKFSELFDILATGVKYKVNAVVQSLLNIKLNPEQDFSVKDFDNLVNGLIFLANNQKYIGIPIDDAIKILTPAFIISLLRSNQTSRYVNYYLNQIKKHIDYKELGLLTENEVIRLRSVLES